MTKGDADHAIVGMARRRDSRVRITTMSAHFSERSSRIVSNGQQTTLTPSRLVCRSKTLFHALGSVRNLTAAPPTLGTLWASGMSARSSGSGLLGIVPLSEAAPACLQPHVVGKRGLQSAPRIKLDAFADPLARRGWVHADRKPCDVQGIEQVDDRLSFVPSCLLSLGITTRSYRARAKPCREMEPSSAVGSAEHLAHGLPVRFTGSAGPSRRVRARDRAYVRLTSAVWSTMRRCFRERARRSSGSGFHVNIGICGASTDHGQQLFVSPRTSRAQVALRRGPLDRDDHLADSLAAELPRCRGSGQHEQAVEEDLV